MKKNLFAGTLIALLVAGICFAAIQMPKHDFTAFDILGPEVVSPDSQNVWQVVAIRDDNSMVEVTADAEVRAYPDDVAVINLGAVIETLKDTDTKQFTIRATYLDMATEKTVTISSVCKNR